MARREKPVFLNDPQWYKDAVIYQVHVKSFYDANNDGIGDFAGLIEKLDYIADLGVNTLGCCRSTRRHAATTATTSPSTVACTATTAASPTPAGSSPRPIDAVCG